MDAPGGIEGARRWSSGLWWGRWKSSWRRRGGFFAAVVLVGMMYGRAVRARPCRVCWDIVPVVVGVYAGWKVGGWLL